MLDGGFVMHISGQILKSKERHTPLNCLTVLQVEIPKKIMF
jgi:hypothetical protein